MEKIELKYLKSIAKQYPTIASAATEIVNLQAILNLPKGTEQDGVSGKPEGTCGQCGESYTYSL